MHLHLSVIIHMNVLLHECCCLRLERDICATSSSMSLCIVLDVGISPALSLCELFMPAPCCALSSNSVQIQNPLVVSATAARKCWNRHNLGWDWDLRSGVLACPENKYANWLRLIQDWPRRAVGCDSFYSLKLNLWLAYSVDFHYVSSYHRITASTQAFLKEIWSTIL